LVERRRAGSLEFVLAYIKATDAGVPANISGDPVAFAFTRRDEEPADWVTGAWASTTPLPGGGYTARCLVGPGGAVTLTPATYTVSVKITDSPEIPVIDCGQLIIT
jgi:hypothetical protein